MIPRGAKCFQGGAGAPPPPPPPLNETLDGMQYSLVVLLDDGDNW